MLYNIFTTEEEGRVILDKDNEDYCNKCNDVVTTAWSQNLQQTISGSWVYPTWSDSNYKGESVVLDKTSDKVFKQPTAI